MCNDSQSPEAEQIHPYLRLQQIWKGISGAWAPRLGKKGNDAFILNTLPVSSSENLMLTYKTTRRRAPKEHPLYKMILVEQCATVFRFSFAKL
jgi:hypothetical protein